MHKTNLLTVDLDCNGTIVSVQIVSPNEFAVSDTGTFTVCFPGTVTAITEIPVNEFEPTFDASCDCP